MSHFVGLATTTTLILAVLAIASATTVENVVDVEGDPVIAGAYYYAMPIEAQKGGGLTMFNNGSKACPNFIVARSIKANLDFGIPIKFSPQSIVQNKNIYVSSNVSIAFKFLSPQPLCRRRYTTVWAVSSNGNTIVLDGEEGRDGSVFKLEAYDDKLRGAYKVLAKEKTVLHEKKASGAILLGLDRGTPLSVVLGRLDV